MSDYFTGTRPVNSVFTDEDGVSLKVVESLLCEECYYHHNNCLLKTQCGQCSTLYRNDEKSVIFVRVEGGENG